MKRNFDEFYNELKNTEDKDLKLKWEAAKKENKKLKISLIVILIIDIIMIYICTLFRSRVAMVMSLPTMVLIDLVILIVSMVFLGKNSIEYRRAFKSKVISKLLGNFFDEVEYDLEEKMTSAEYDKGRYRESYDHFISDDFMTGKFDNKYKMKMAEVETQREEEDEDKTETVTVFHGLFVEIELDKSINNDLFISQNKIFFDKNKIELDSQEFEKIFDVSSESEIIGHQLLTSDIMNLLTDFYRKSKMRFDIGIYDNFLYLRFSTGNMFETSSFNKEIIDEKSLKKHFQILEFIDDLAKLIIKDVEETEV